VVIKTKVKQSHSLHDPDAMGLRGKVLVAGVYRVVFCEKLLEASSCLIKPAGSKMDSPLSKAKPISDGGSASVITYLRRGRKNLQGDGS